MTYTNPLLSSLAMAASLCLMQPAHAATLLQVEIGPQDGNHVPGSLTDPICCTYPNFALHDHGYVAAHIPDPNRAWVTMVFDVPVVLSALEVVQHGNGITAIEQFGGPSMNDLASLGSVFGLRGDVTGSSVFAEFERDTFSWSSQAASTVHHFIVRKTSLHDGWASYRWYPEFNDPAPIPEPQTYALMALGLALLAVRRSAARPHQAG